MGTRWNASLPCGLRGGGDEGGGGVHGGVVEVDFFDEADGELIVGEPDVLTGVDAGIAVLAHPPEGHGTEDSDGSVGGGRGGVCLEDVRPDDGVTAGGEREERQERESGGNGETACRRGGDFLNRRERRFGGRLFHGSK